MAGLLLPVSNSAAPFIRLLGVALLALGVACWFARADEPSLSARGTGYAMLVYNLGAAVTLGASAILSPPSAIALWAAVIVHAAMAGLCIACLTAKPSAV